MSPGRYSACRKYEEVLLNFYPPKHQAKENSTSMLVHREATLKSRGKGHFMEKDTERFKNLDQTKN